MLNLGLSLAFPRPAPLRARLGGLAVFFFLHALRILHQLLLGLGVAGRDQAVQEAAGTAGRVAFVLGFFNLAVQVSGGFFVDVVEVMVFFEVGWDVVLADGPSG